MNWNLMNNDELVLTLKSLVQKERELATQILHLLDEVDRRKLYLEQGYGSLFDWCMGVLGYSNGAAHRRIQSMRLIRALPEVEAKIESGELSLSVAAQAQSYFRQEDLRRKESHAPKLDPLEKKTLVEDLLGLSSREAERKLSLLSPEPEAFEKKQLLRDGRTLIQFTASPELMAQLEDLQALLSHQNPEGKLEGLVKLISQMALKKLLGPSVSSASKSSNPRVSKQKSLEPKGLEPKNLESKTSGSSTLAPTSHSSTSTFPTSEIESKTSTSASKHKSSTADQASQTSQRDFDSLMPPPEFQTPSSRYIPIANRRTIWREAQSRCTFIDPKTGKVCSSRYRLQIDHLLPYALGGTHSVDNLTLRCAAHNRYAAKKFGLTQPTLITVG